MGGGEPIFTPFPPLYRGLGFSNLWECSPLSSACAFCLSLSLPTALTHILISLQRGHISLGCSVLCLSRALLLHQFSRQSIFHWQGDSRPHTWGLSFWHLLPWTSIRQNNSKVAAAVGTFWINRQHSAGYRGTFLHCWSNITKSKQTNKQLEYRAIMQQC